MDTPIRVLAVVEGADPPDPVAGLIDNREQFAVTTASSIASARESLEDDTFDAVVSGYELPDGTGLELLDVVRNREPLCPFVLLLSTGDGELVSDALDAGVTDAMQLSEPGGAAVLANRLERNIGEGAEMERHRRRIQEIITDTGSDIDDRIDRLLAFGLDLLGVENAHVVETDREEGSHEIRFARGSNLVTVGAVSDLSETFCRRTLDTEETLDIPDAGGDGEPVDDQWSDIRRYVGVKLLVDDGVFGTLCFVDQEASPTSLSGPERVAVDLIGRWISHALERREAETRREEIFGRMTDGLFALDEDWRFTYLNDRGAEIIGEAMGKSYSPAEIEGRHIWEEIPEAVDTTFYDKYHEAMNTQEPVSFESYYEPIDRWFSVRVFPSETGISVYFLDITERQRREDAIRNREEILREVYDVVSDVDRTFDEQVGALLDIGRQVIGTEYGSLSRVRGEEYVFEVVRAPEGTIEAGDVVDLSATHCERAVVTEESLVLADIASEAPELTERAGFVDWGIECYLGTPVRVDGQVYGTFCFYGSEPREEPFSEWQVTLVDLMGRWISYGLERQRVEEQLRRQNDRLEEFASRLSHDLRNPLNVASLHLNLLADELDEPHPEHVRKIQDAHGRIEALISDILTMAREGAVVEETERVSLREVAMDAWAHVESEGATLDVADDLAFRADSERLGRVFENLFRNAVEHGSTDPDSLSLRVGRLRDGFYVEDDGVGIPPEDREEVFEYGYSTDSDGTGFGLGIVREIVEAHGWTLDLTESSAGGARFEITGVDIESG